MKTKEQLKHGTCKVKIESYEDLLYEITERFENFLSDFPERGLTREPGEDDPEEDGICFFYTHKAQVLIDRFLGRMQIVFEKYFPEDEFEIDTYMYREI